MTSLKKELTARALNGGAIRARVTIKERLDGPPSADPTSVLPGARPVVSYAVYLCSVLTDAELEPDEPLDEELCDSCRRCP